MEATAGIERAAVASAVPLTESFVSNVARDRPDGADERWPGVMHAISDAYFDVMGLRLVEGRLFADRDRISEAEWISGETSRAVAVVSQATARTLWPDRSALRNRVRLVVRGPGSAATLVATVTDAVERASPGTRLTRIAPLDTLVTQATSQPRFVTRLVTSFGALALLLAAVGIYGSLALLVQTRRREIGIRLVLGASGGRIVAPVVVRALAPALVGGVAGLAVTMMLARLFEGLLFDLDPLDPVSFVGGAGLLVSVVLAATLGPARRAMGFDPAEVLRSE